MGLAQMPEQKVFDEVFAELDEDGSGDISMQEMKDFLRKIFLTQRDEIASFLESQNISIWFKFDSRVQ